MTQLSNIENCKIVTLIENCKLEIENYKLFKMVKTIKNKKTSQRGFGLVEVLVSITIISFVIVAFNQIAIYAYYNWEDAKAKSVAYNLIQSTMEDLRNRRDVNVNTAGKTWVDPTTFPTPADGVRTFYTDVVIGGKIYDTYLTISSVTANLLNQPPLTTSKKKVVVEVSWTERVGDRSLKATTYFTDWKSKY